jgi:hypothetical protein
VDGASEVHQRRSHVQALVDTLTTAGLHTEHLSAALLEDDLDDHGLGAGVVGGVVVGDDMHGGGVEAGVGGRLEREPGDAGRGPEHADDAGAHGGRCQP